MGKNHITSLSFYTEDMKYSKVGHTHFFITSSFASLVCWTPQNECWPFVKCHTQPVVKRKIALKKKNSATIFTVCSIDLANLRTPFILLHYNVFSEDETQHDKSNEVAEHRTKLMTKPFSRVDLWLLLI